jgi:hypothetical protein
VGSNAAKSLAAALGKPLVGVHHMVRSYIPLLSRMTLIHLISASTRLDTSAHDSNSGSPTVSFLDTAHLRRSYASTFSFIPYLV